MLEPAQHLPGSDTAGAGGLDRVAQATIAAHRADRGGVGVGSDHPYDLPIGGIGAAGREAHLHPAHRRAHPFVLTAVEDDGDRNTLTLGEGLQAPGETLHRGRAVAPPAIRPGAEHVHPVDHEPLVPIVVHNATVPGRRGRQPAKAAAAATGPPSRRAAPTR